MKNFILVFLLLSNLSLIAQNLVLNHSFEELTFCTSMTGGLENAVNWTTSQNSPDLLNTCAGSTPNAGVGAPSNVVGYQYPASGNSYIGILGYSSFASTYNPDLREYCNGELQNALEVGEKYYVSMRITLGDKASHAVNNLGAKFLTSNIVELPITNQAHVYTTSVINDTMNWVLVAGSFIADSAYTHVAIGNHFNDAMTQVEEFQPQILGHNAYYFVDDVCVSTDSMSCASMINSLQQVGPNSTTVEVSPNPFSNYLKINTDANELLEIRVYNLLGTMILKEKFSQEITLETDGLLNGVYLYEVVNKAGIVKKGKLLKRTH